MLWEGYLPSEVLDAELIVAIHSCPDQFVIGGTEDGNLSVLSREAARRESTAQRRSLSWTTEATRNVNCFSVSS